MTKKEFTSRILKSSQVHWGYVLSGKRNLGYKRAKLVSQLFNTDIEVWMNPKMKLEREKAWKRFSEGDQ